MPFKQLTKTPRLCQKASWKTEADINSFFAQVMDDPSIQIVTDAQKWYAQEK